MTDAPLPCPSCSRPTRPAHLCGCESPACRRCCEREHDACPDCYGRGSVRITLRVPGVGREQRDIPCASCEDERTSTKEKDQ